MARGTVSETYHAALAHDLVEVPDDATLVGVVRRPTGWFRSEIDENHPELGPPEGLLESLQDRREDLKMQGMCHGGAHNAAWENMDFGERYREHLAESEPTQAALSGLADRVAGGEDIVLVCYEGDSKRCHRRLLENELDARVTRGGR